MCTSTFSVRAGGTTIDSASANAHVANALEAGDAPNGVYIMPLSQKTTGEMRISAGASSGSSRSILATSGGTTAGLNYDCPPFCRQMAIDNAGIPSENLAYVTTQLTSGLSSSEVRKAVSEFEAGTADKFTIPGDAITWLQKQGAAYFEVARGRDRNNNCELIIAGYDRGGTVLGEGQYYVVPVACPGE